MINIKTSIIIPCYNEAEIIQITAKRIKAVLDTNQFEDYEIIFINDGSIDDTYILLQNLAVQDKRIKILDFSRNFGHQAAVSAGLQYCSGDVAIIIDADLQDPPDLFPDMIHLYQAQKCNVVYGVRQEREGDTWFKKFTARIFYRLLNYLSEHQFPLDTGDFRLIDRQVINAFNQLQERNKYIRGLISWLGYRQVPLFYQREKRYAGKTKYTLWKMLHLAETGIFYFSKKPLNLAINLGFFCLLTGLFLMAYTIIIKLSLPLDYVGGWASLMIAIIFFGGVQLLTIGILGKYIGNIFDEVKRRPEYIVSKKINFE